MMKLLILLAVAVAGVPTAHGQDSFPAVKGRVTDASTGSGHRLRGRRDRRHEQSDGSQNDRQRRGIPDR